MSARVTEALQEALKLCSLADTMTACRGDDDFIAGVRAKIEAALSTEPREAPTHRHKKRGTTYRVIAEGLLQASGWVRHITIGKAPSEASVDMAPVVIYQGEDGAFWVRPAHEFHDGRFETLPAAPLPEDTHHGREDKHA